MFDRAGFDKLSFDRGAGIEVITALLRAEGRFDVSAIFRTPIEDFLISSRGRLSGELLMAQNLEFVRQEWTGVGNLVDIPLILRMPLNVSLSGSGDLILNPSVAIPLGLINLGGNGDIFVSDAVLMRQFMNASLSGQGSFSATGFTIVTPFLMPTMTGEGSFPLALRVLVDVGTTFSGSGAIRPFLVGDVSTEVLEFINLNLAPGSVLEIDTDQLEVFINGARNVANVTTESIFFQLIPGENTITITSDEGYVFEVTFIWQNRWL